MKQNHWLGHELDLAESSGGVLAFANPWEGVVRGSVVPWPPPELVQKLYQSWQVRAFRDAERECATNVLGYYSDLQSVHSEDAVTWSLFGPVVYSAPEVRRQFAMQLLAVLGLQRPLSHANVWLWRRLPHPDTLAPGGPEIDFGIQTEDTLILGEAKWRSGVGAAQGVARDKDQIQLRAEYCAKYGAKVFPRVRDFLVLAVGRRSGMLTDAQRAWERANVLVREVTWESLSGLYANPVAEEFRAQLVWREAHSQI